MGSKRKKSSKKGAKKSSKKEEKAEKAESSGLPEGFWGQVTVIIVILMAILIIFGSLGTGGPVAVQLFESARWLIGYFAYLVPIVMVVAAVGKQRSESHKLPRSTFFGIIFMVAMIAGFLHLFVGDDSLLAVEEGRGGGIVGHMTSSAVLTMLNKLTGGIVLFVLFVISLHFVLKIPLTRFLKIMRVEKKKKDLEIHGESKADDEPGFKLNEGVPIQREALKKLKKADSSKESHDALTTLGDQTWELPGLDLLNNKQEAANAGDIEGNADIIKDTLADFNINVEMSGANIGPRVTQFTLVPPAGVKLGKITALENNIALNLAATSIRMEAPIPGKRAVGIEVPNLKPATVNFHGVVTSDAWKRSGNKLSFALGKDISGSPMVGNLDSMPHLLIAGQTGSGKSVMINTLLCSFLYRNSPADLKLILVDPKHVELTSYQDMPHLLTPVITEPEKAISALKWAVAEMERRYVALQEVGKRSIIEYNKLKNQPNMPNIVIVVDELADLMQMASRDVEGLIARLTAKARAVGIHMVIATQRPEVKVITGLIKANVPARIAFTTVSQVDSRTILDQGGAEKLLGKGDMLYSTAETHKPIRIQGAFISDKEIDEITNFVKEQRQPEYDDEVISQPVQIGGNGRGGVMPMDNMGDDEDNLYMDAVQVVIDSGKASSSLLQRRLRVGYSRAARLIESMEEHGIVGPADGAKPRQVLINSIDELSDGGQSADEDFGEI